MLALAPALIPAVYLAAGLLCLAAPRGLPLVLQARWNRVASLMGEAAAATALALAVAMAVFLAQAGPATQDLFASEAFGVRAFRLATRVDIVSTVAALLVCFTGWIVARYAKTYLQGETRQGVFTGWLLLTLGAVTAFVLAADLSQMVAAWIATSVFLHRLLVFYGDRPHARRAARKKFITARLSDLALIGGALLLVKAYGTTDIASILSAAGQNSSTAAWPAVWAAGLLAAAAALKSAQFPAHGWLTEVMETPTPVSALLHAGVINAGGFLLIRFADVVILSHITMAALVIIGGFTALFGSIVMLTQPAVKTSLTWSTVAQMGFMILQCGLGLFPLALAHIVAHSLYKAHSFLASGGMVERITHARRLGPVAVPNARAVGQAFLAAILIYAVVAVGFGFLHKPPQAIALGAILIFGVAYLFAQGLAGLAPRALAVRTTLYALAASVSYFLLQAAAEHLTRGALPAPPAPGLLEWILITLTAASFAGVAVLQALLPLWVNHPAVAGLRVHVSNGFYINAVFDRLIGGWNVRQSI